MRKKIDHSSFDRAVKEKSPTGPHFVVIRDEDENRVLETLFIPDQEQPGKWLAENGFVLLEQFHEFPMVRVKRG